MGLDQNRALNINFTPGKIWQYVNPFNVSVYDLQGNLVDPEKVAALQFKAKKQEEKKTKLISKLPDSMAVSTQKQAAAED